MKTAYKKFRNPTIIQWGNGTFGLRGGYFPFYYYLYIKRNQFGRTYSRKYAQSACEGTLIEVRTAHNEYIRVREESLANIKVKVIGKLE